MFLKPANKLLSGAADRATNHPGEEHNNQSNTLWSLNSGLNPVDQPPGRGESWPPESQAKKAEHVIGMHHTSYNLCMISLVPHIATTIGTVTYTDPHRANTSSGMEMETTVEMV